MARHQFGPVRRIVAARRIGQHDARAARGRPEKIVDGQVEAQFGQPQHHVARADRMPRADVGERIAHRRVAQHHALRLAGGARRIDHVSQCIWSDVACGARRPLRIDRHRIDIDAHATVMVECERLHADDRTHSRIAQNGLLPQRRLAAVDRHVRGARLDDREHGRELVRALRHQYGDGIAHADARLFERGTQRRRLLRDLAVRARPPCIDHDRRIGRAQRLRGETGRDMRIGIRVHVGDGRRGRQHDVTLTRPPCGIVGQTTQQRDIRVEHRGRHAVRKQVVAHVPADFQPAELVGHLAVEPHLRRLADHGARRRGARRVPRVLAEQALDTADPAREHHRHQRRILAAPPCEFAHHVDAGERAMVEIVEHPRADRAGTLDEIAPVRRVDGEQAQRGEIAEHRIDARMHGRTVQHRQVQAERRRLAPAADDLGERGQRDARRAQPETARLAAQRGPLRAIEPRMPMREARPPVGAPRGHDRQIGTRGQLVESSEPPCLVARMIGTRRGLRFMQHIVAKRRVERRRLPLRIVVTAPPFGEQQLQARVVDQREIHGQVQHRRLLAEAHFRLQHRPAVERMHRMVEALAHAAQVRVEGVRVGLAKVVHGERLPGHVGQHALPCVVLDDRAQHRMARDARVPRGFEAHAVEILRFVVFDVQVACAAAELERFVATEHIRGLHRRQREPFVPVRRIVAPCAVPKEADERIAFSLDARGEIRIERAGRRAIAQLAAVVAPQFDPPFAAEVEHVVETHSTPSSIVATAASPSAGAAGVSSSSCAARPASVGCR